MRHYRQKASRLQSVKFQLRHARIENWNIEFSYESTFVSIWDHQDEMEKQC